MYHKVRWPPTDLALLEEIYRRYYGDFVNFDRSEGRRSSKIYVPIDCGALAEHFKVDPSIIFGWLYNRLNQRFSVSRDESPSSPFFALKAGDDIRAVHFPLLASVVAEMRAEQRRFRLGVWLSGIALLISIVSIVVSLASTFKDNGASVSAPALEPSDGAVAVKIPSRSR